MALDGITVHAILQEIKDRLLGGRIDKIYQPNQDEIILSIRSIGANFKLLLSANSSHPRIHITNTVKENPMTPPMFCMVLRKYIAGGKIVSVIQPNFERILHIGIESMNELGDKTIKTLTIEIMGKHSNIILTEETDKILDAIKHITHEKSSVREVLPGKQYILPPNQNKKNPLSLTEEEFFALFSQKAQETLSKLLYQSYTGISPVMAAEICYRAGLSDTAHGEDLTASQKDALFSTFYQVMQTVQKNDFQPELIYQSDAGKPLDFSPISMEQFSSLVKKSYASLSKLLEDFYAEKDNTYHIAQKAHDMRRLVLSNIERCVKKKEIQKKTLEDVADKELWRRKGELLTANIYAIKKGQTQFHALDFYDENQTELEIALDPTKTPAENAQRYFQKYNKAKRTLAALASQIQQNEEELAYLENVLVSISSASEDADLVEIRNELAEQGFARIKRTAKGKPVRPKKTTPYHFLSSDGFDIYVGKSNTQNDELTLHFAKPADLWLHTKNIPGSHVIIRTAAETPLPDTTLLEAANLAVYYSKGKDSSTVPVDYTERKNVKKPKGAKPGMVIYEQNRTLYITVQESLINHLQKILD